MKRLILDDRGLSPWARGWVIPLLLVAAGLLVLSPVIFNGGFFWDDATLITDNPAVRLDAYNGGSSLGKIWLSHELPDYFPLTSTLFYVEWRIFGANAGAFHLGNALLHAAAAVFLWLALREMRVPWAALGALLFVIHPINMESGSWIAEGKNTLSTSLMMAALWTWYRGERQRGWGWYAGSLGLFLLSLLAKTSSVPLPVLMVLILWWKGRANVWSLLRTAPYFALSLVLGLVTAWFQQNESIQGVPVRNDDFFSRLATAGCAVWFYLGKVLAPVGVSFCYPRWDVMRAGAIAFFPGILVLAVAATLWALRRKIGRAWAAAWLGYLAMLLPILGFRNIYYMRYTLVSDHWQYPAMWIVCAAVAGGLGAAARRMRPERANALAAAALARMVLLAVDAGYISNVYRSELSVWQDVLSHDPNSFLANERIGEMILEEAIAKKPELAKDAMVYFEKSIAVAPQHALGYIHLANTYELQGNREEARQLLQKAFTAPLGSPAELGDAHGNYGALLGQQGDEAGALREFQENLRINPESVSAWKRMGLLSLAHHDLAGAKAAYEKAVRFGPLSLESRLSLARILLALKDDEGAWEQVRLALEIDPTSPEGNLLKSRLGHFDALLPPPPVSASIPAGN